MYDRGKVDFTDAEHERAQKIDASIESILASLDDGFSPLSDLPTIGMGVWGLVDAVRTAASESVDANGNVDKAALARKLVTSVEMLERDNEYV